MQLSSVTASRFILVSVLLISTGGCLDNAPTDPVVDGVTPLPAPPPPTAPPVDTTRAPSVNDRTIIWLANGDIRVLADAAGAELAAADLSDMGEVAGIVVGDGRRSVEAFVWSETAGVRRIGTIGGPDGGLIVTAINSAGTVVGYKSPFTGNYVRSFIGSATSELRPLSADIMWASDINDSGTVAVNTPNGPFKLHSQSGLEPLALTHSECTVATAINDHGDVLGWNGDELFGMGCVPQAWIVWRGSAPPAVITSCPLGCELDLVAMNDGGIAAGRDGSDIVRLATTGATPVERLAGAFATDINDMGDIVGGTKWPDVRPLVWKSDGRVVHLPLPPGKTQGRAIAINNRGDIVGSVW